MARATEAPALDPHGDLLELPILLWAGKPEAFGSGSVEMRSAIGATPSGRVLLARGRFANPAPLADVLSRAGCTRALLLDRGSHATAFLDRAGSADPPRGRYEESVIYAIATPLRPRGFHFEASRLVAQGANPK
jgi:hypothetical protein